MKKHKHKWIVYSTALATRAILVECECGKMGSITDPTTGEWSDAFYAPSAPYEWHDHNRVIVSEWVRQA